MIGIDGAMLSKALVYAIVTIDGLPEEHKMQSERDDIVHLLNIMMPDPVDRERLAQEVEAVTGSLADLTDWEGRGHPWDSV